LRVVDLLTRFAIGRGVVTKNLVVEAFGVVSRFVRKVRTASGAVAVQVVTRRWPRRGWMRSRTGPANRSCRRSRRPVGALPPSLRVAGTSADLLWAVLTSAYAQLGFEVLADDGFRAMVLARIVERPPRPRWCGS
jgi:hypothetical protein